MGGTNVTTAPNGPVAGVVIEAGTFWKLGGGTFTVTVNMTGTAWLPAGSCAVHVTFVVPARKSVPLGVGHETKIWFGGSSGSVAETENDTFVQTVIPHPAVALATMFPGPEMTGGVVSTALRASAPLAEPSVATSPAAKRRLNTNLMASDYARVAVNQHALDYLDG